MLNRFIIQATLGHPLTVYGNGTQTRGYLNINDTVECVRLACENPAERGEFRVFNQMTETFALNQLAETVEREFPGEVTINHVDNPRVEIYDHYYKVVHTALPSLGLKPTLLADSLVTDMFKVVERYKDRVIPVALDPSTVKWAETTSTLPTAPALAEA